MNDNQNTARCFAPQIFHRPGIRVLLIDSNELTQKVLSDHFATTGVKFSSAINLPAAVFLLLARPFDFVLINQLPSDNNAVSALSLARFIKNRRAATEIILLSDITTPDFLPEAGSCGVDHLLSKPLLIEKVNAIVCSDSEVTGLSRDDRQTDVNRTLQTKGLK